MMSRSGAAQDRLDRGPRHRYRIAEFGKPAGWIGTLRKVRLQPGGGIGNGESTDRAGRAFQRMRQRGPIRRHGGKLADQPGRLGSEHRQHLLLEAGIAKRDSFEMFEIYWTVIGSERRRWHPFYPFEMKRHGLTQIALP